MSLILYISLCGLGCGYALRRGHRYERLVAGACILGAVATLLVSAPLNRVSVHSEVGALLINLAVLIALVAISLRSDRFWPLWTAGLQLTITAAQFLKVWNANLMPRAYELAVGFWTYLIPIILLAGTWRSYRRVPPRPMAYRMHRSIRSGAEAKCHLDASLHSAGGGGRNTAAVAKENSGHHHGSSSTDHSRYQRYVGVRKGG